MPVEIIVTAVIIAVAGFIFYKNLKKSTSGDCNCGSCSSSCPKYGMHMQEQKKQE